MERPPSAPAPEPLELLATDLGVFEDARRQGALKVTRVHWDDHRTTLVRVDEVMVAARYSRQAPPRSLENLRQVFGCERRKPLAHASIVTCSRIGVGIGQPSSFRVAR